MNEQIGFDAYGVLIKEDRHDGYIYICPNCKTYICSGYECKKCGQALDWSKPNKEYTGKHHEQ